MHAIAAQVRRIIAASSWCSFCDTTTDRDLQAVREPMSRTMADLINGVPREQYGMWCQHGHHIMVANPDVPGDYPGTVMADPWPCTEGCTPESVAADMEAEGDAYEQERWDEYRASQ